MPDGLIYLQMELGGPEEDLSTFPVLAGMEDWEPECRAVLEHAQQGSGDAA